MPAARPAHPGFSQREVGADAARPVTAKGISGARSLADHQACGVRQVQVVAQRNARDGALQQCRMAV